jgi:hypothetical protein
MLVASAVALAAALGVLSSGLKATPLRALSEEAGTCLFVACAVDHKTHDALVV